MKKSVSYIAVLLLTVFAFGIAAFAHAGNLPASSAVFAADGSIPEVSTEYEVTIPLETTRAFTLEQTQITLNYKQTAQLTSSEDAQWQSSDSSVVIVNEEGLLTAAGRGSATVTATAKDGRTAVCTVTVRYTFWQWIIRIFLFGWLWY